MTSFIRVAGQPVAGYREESARHAIIIALVALLLTGWVMTLFFRQSINENKLQATMIHNLDAETIGVGKIIEDIQKALTVESWKGPITEERQDQELPPSPEELNKLPGTMNGIIWSASNPLVMIDDKLYPVGDNVIYTLNGDVIGFKIVDISEETVVFRNPFGVEFEESLYKESDKLKTE